jgi:hypothetical protein
MHAGLRTGGEYHVRPGGYQTTPRPPALETASRNIDAKRVRAHGGNQGSCKPLGHDELLALVPRDREIALVSTRDRSQARIEDPDAR